MFSRTTRCCYVFLCAFPMFWFPGVSAKDTPSKPSSSTRDIARQATPSVAQLTIRDGSGEIVATGSGFVVAPDLIATNFHVIQNAFTATANYEGGRSEKIIGVEAYSMQLDIALLYTSTAGIPSLPLGDSSELEPGDDITTIGAPKGLGGTVSTGIVSAVRAIEQNKVIQITAPVSHGSSGGPLLDSKGNVVGMTSYMLGEGQNLNFAIPAYYIKTLIPKDRENFWPLENFFNAKAEEDTSEPDFSKHPLAFIRRVSLVLDGLPDEASELGITEKRVEQTIQAALNVGTQTITVTDNEDEVAPSLYVSLSMMPTGLVDGKPSGYAGNWYIQLYQFKVAAAPGYEGLRVMAPVEYYCNQRMFTTGTDAEGDSAFCLEILRDLVKAFGSSIASDTLAERERIKPRTDRSALEKGEWPEMGIVVVPDSGTLGNVVSGEGFEVSIYMPAGQEGFPDPPDFWEDYITTWRIYTPEKASTSGNQPGQYRLYKDRGASPSGPGYVCTAEAPGLCGVEATVVSKKDPQLRHTFQSEFVIDPKDYGSLPPMEATPTERIGACEYRMTNDTEYRLQVFLSGSSGTTLWLEPGTSKSVSLTPGKYRMMVKAPGSDILPLYGTREYDPGNDYSSRFIIKTQH